MILLHRAQSNITDTNLRDRVERQLDWEPEITSTDIGVATDNGVVTLTGFVDSYAEKLAAEGYDDMSQILDLMQQRENWNDIAAELGEKPDAVRKRIRRWLSKRSDLAERILLSITDSRRKR